VRRNCGTSGIDWNTHLFKRFWLRPTDQERPSGVVSLAFATMLPLSLLNSSEMRPSFAPIQALLLARLGSKWFHESARRKNPLHFSALYSS